MTPDAEMDRPGAVRPGEELPLAALAAYLTAHLPHLAGPLTVAQFPQGYSNLTYLLRMGDREMVLRRPPVGVHIATAHDMSREVRVLTGLSRVYDKVPRPLLYCDDPSVIGAPFYIMERLHGVILRAGLEPAQAPPPAVMAGLSAAAVDNLAAIHALDVEAAGLAGLGKPAGYTARQIHGWTQRYQAAQTDPQPELEAAMAWLAHHIPPEAGAAIIHNDYKYDNLLLDPADLTCIRAVLDWEMCTLGDPLMDLGTMLGYWTEPGDPPPLAAMFGLTTLPGNLNRQQVVERYCAASRRAIPDPLFYYVYGLVKVDVIIQQLYTRYRHGHTQDARYAALPAVVQSCGRLAALALEKGRISRLQP
ncbi:MAG TPA: phosphotransferase family protein [Caldilineaceae bacterium]|nr:phosphotransferase family protein [Caldilineaceae bacterium]